MNFVNLAIFQAVEFVDRPVDFLVFWIPRTTTTTRSTIQPQKVIVLVQILTLLTYAYCVTIVWTYSEDQRHQGQAKLSKGRKRPEDSITAALVY